MDSSTNKWEITDATKLADLDAEYGGGFSFIPSGSNKNNIFFSDWDNNIVKMLKFGTDGRPLVPTETTDFITGIEGPWGFFFDPQVSVNLYLHRNLLPLELLGFHSASSYKQTPFLSPIPIDERLFRIYLVCIF